MIADRKEVKAGDIWRIHAKNADIYLHYLILSNERLKEESGYYGWDVLCLETGKNSFSGGAVGVWEKVA